MKFALIGGKLGHSYSAVIHELFFELTGLKGSYDLIEVPTTEQLKGKINWFNKNDYTGINVTIPYKEEVLKYIDSKSDEVITLNAANTLHFSEGKVKAYNTDYFGFKRTLDISDIDPYAKKWLVLGCGGGAKSIIAVLKDMNAAEVIVANRTKYNVNIIGLDEISNIEKFDGVVNTTPVGMYPEIGVSPITLKDINKFKIAIDIVYNPLETEFLKISNKAGLKIVKGLYMLVAQAVKAQEIWQNREFSNDLIDEIYQKVGAELR